MVNDFAYEAPAHGGGGYHDELIDVQLLSAKDPRFLFFLILVFLAFFDRLATAKHRPRCCDFHAVRTGAKRNVRGNWRKPVFFWRRCETPQSADCAANRSKKTKQQPIPPLDTRGGGGGSRLVFFFHRVNPKTRFFFSSTAFGGGMVFFWDIFFVFHGTGGGNKKNRCWTGHVVCPVHCSESRLTTLCVSRKPLQA